jgi:hypothetical protein
MPKMASNLACGAAALNEASSTFQDEFFNGKYSQNEHFPTSAS